MSDLLDTPALVVDLDRLESNIAHIARACQGNGVAWRPHFKGHKTIEIARLQLTAGAIGITCAKLGEAEVLAAGGITNILIANQIVGAAKIARLEAEVAGRAPVFPPADNPAMTEQIAIERSLHVSRMADLNSLLAAANARTIQAERSVAEAEAAYSSRESALSAARTELDLIRPLVERGIEPRLSLVQAENSAAIASGDLAAASATIARARSSVAEARSTLAQQRQDWRSRAAQELAAAQGEMVARRGALPALSARVERTVVRSPLAGRVNRVLVTTVGGTVAPGAPLVEIVPTNESLIIEAMIRPSDIAWVRHDQPAKINISAYDSSIYGSLHGKVVAISPDATLNERTGESFYTVRIAADGRLRDGAGKPLDIGPGMVAEVSLLGDKRSVMSYILTPITRISERALREQ